MNPPVPLLSVFLASLWLWPSSDVGRLAEERLNLQRQIEGLPARRPFAPSTAVGFHSRWVPKENTALSVTLDLGEEHPLDTLFVVPAFAPSGWGYGFPNRYKVEVATENTFKTPLVLLDRTHEDHPVPNGPIQVPGGGVSARWVRFTASKLQRQPNWEQGYMFCLGEMFAFSRGQNVALGCKVEGATGQNAYYPTWTAENLVDGITSLGLPVEPDVSDSKDLRSGWHSLDAPSPDTEKWVQIDLGRVLSIQEIRAIPANPVTFTNRPGFGFPVRFKIELSETPGFEVPLRVVDRTAVDYPNPGDNVACWRVPHLKGRYVRFTATRLFLRWNDYVFALAEMEVISEGINVARGALVTCPEKTPNVNFQPEFLVDGRSSSGTLLDQQMWLGALALRSELEQRLEVVLASEAQAKSDENRRWQVWGGSGGGLLVLVGVALFWRSRRQRVRQLQELRQQIARDLHDEIGSSLGSIALISELGKQDGDLDSLEEIHQLAVDAADSMRGILWMIRDGKPPTLLQLETALRTQSEQALRGMSAHFERHGEPPAMEFVLPFHRNVFLFFKEALHNVARHSQADSASVKLEWSPRMLCIEVTDTGRGFDVAARFSGSGLANMRHRAESLNARLVMTSEPGKGTRLSLEVPLL